MTAKSTDKIAASDIDDVKLKAHVSSNCTKIMWRLYWHAFGVMGTVKWGLYNKQDRINITWVIGWLCHKIIPLSIKILNTELCK